jgi:hypothetical protein
MERVCSVCGGAKKDLFSSTYCPRCEGDVKAPVGDWMSVVQVRDYLDGLTTLTGFSYQDMAQSSYRDVVFLTFRRSLPAGVGPSCEYFDAIVTGSGAPRAVIEYYAKCMGAK